MLSLWANWLVTKFGLNSLKRYLWPVLYSCMYAVSTLPDIFRWQCKGGIWYDTFASTPDLRKIFLYVASGIRRILWKFHNWKPFRVEIKK